MIIYNNNNNDHTATLCFEYQIRMLLIRNNINAYNIFCTKAYNMMAENVTSAQVRRHRTERPKYDTNTVYARVRERQQLTGAHWGMFYTVWLG